jgi:hypothetical protein
MRLEVFLAAHCITCNEALRLVEHVRRDFPTVEVRVHDLDADPQARRPEVFAVPTYVLDGRVLSIGNPDERTLAAALSADGTARGERRAQRRAWPFPRAAAMLGGALAVLSCGGPLAALAVVALQHVPAFPAPPAGLVAVGRLLESIADPTWALGSILLIVGLARRGRCPVILAVGGCLLLHGSMLVVPTAPGPLPAPDLASTAVMLAGLAAVGGALLLGTAARPARPSICGLSN